jgi:hypothetical protein
MNEWVMFDSRKAYQTDLGVMNVANVISELERSQLSPLKKLKCVEIGDRERERERERGPLQQTSKFRKKSCDPWMT